jgi:hypothetical protein
VSDILDVHEQDAIADTLVAPLHSTYESQDDTSYAHADGEDGVDFGQEQEPVEDSQELNPEQDGELPQATPEDRAAYQHEMQQWAALPQDQQATRADEYLTQGYTSAYESISPKEAENFTNTVGEQWGNPNLSAIVDPLTFASFADTWSDNVERTISMHPNGPAFLQALSNDPQQALELAAGMCDPVMVGRFFSHFQNLVGNPALFQGRDPLQFAAECILDVAKLQGWGRQQQAAPQRSRQKFQTNRDIFSDDVLDRFRTL